MSLLFSFIKFLNTEELNRLRLVPLSGKEKLVLETILQQPESKELTKTEAIHQLGLSSSHYDKIGTVILKKAYRSLAGEDELEQLNFLSKKFMFRHLFHEIRQQMVLLKEGKIPEAEREKYAAAMFNFTVNVPAKFFDEAFVKANAAVYLNCVKENKQSKELEVRAKILFGRLNKLAQQSPDPEVTGNLLKEVIGLESQYKDFPDLEPRKILYHILVNYYRQVEMDTVRRTHYLEKIATLYGGFDQMPPFEKCIAECHFAEMHFETGLYTKAYEMYLNLFRHNMKHLKNQFHHFARCIELALILEDYQAAQEMLDTLFKVYVINRHESTGVVGAIQYAQLYLKSGNLNKAYEYISIAKSVNSIQVYFHFEIRIRMLEALYFAFAGDYDFVTRLSQRNIRYIQLQKLSLKTYKYAHFFYLLKDIKNLLKYYPDRMPPKVNFFLTQFNQGYDKLLGQLLERLLSEAAELALQQSKSKTKSS